MLVITLNTFFNSVFSDWAKPRAILEGTTLTAEQQTTKDKRDAKAIEEKKEQFKFITKNTKSSVAFRSMLRNLNNSDLEILLYGNNTDEIIKTTSSNQYAFPNNEAIKEQFKNLEQKYGYYFAKDINAPDVFIKLFKACKLIADYVEKNNSDDNLVAYIHAYKMMVLFKVNPSTPFNAVDTFLKTHASHVNKPIHDTLVLPIPTNNPPLKYLDKWRKLVNERGTSFLRLFQQADKIEKELDKKETPWIFTLQAVKEAASMLTYKKAADNLELAKLCLQYRVREKDFDKCLTIKPKQSDQLPDVMVDGNTVGQRGYYLVKLPVNDPRAYILGHITNCCQSIGSPSERCVIDGITLPSNGFYVLLQAKSGTEQPPLRDGKINYDHFEIVGQGYAWLSQLNNLTFDSWENRTPNPNDTVIQAILPKFAQQCFEQNPDIGRITIGNGGKTPQAYSKTIAYPEKMAEGYQYHDSAIQVLIAMNPEIENRKGIIASQLTKMGVTNEIDIWSIKQAQWFATLLEENTVIAYQQSLGESVYIDLLQKAVEDPTILLIVALLHQTKHLTPEVVRPLQTLTTSGATIVAEGLSTLYRANPALVTQENFTLLVENAQDANGIADVLSTLYRASHDLITQENVTLLIQHARDARDIAKGLSTLYQANPALITPENRTLFAQHAQHASYIAEGLSILYRANPALVTQENFTMLIQHARDARGIAYGLSVLHRANPALVTQENFTLLVQHAQDAYGIAEGLSTLYRANPALVTQENRTLLVQHAQDAYGIAEGLSTLYRASPDLITQENFTLLVENAPYSEKIVDEFLKLYRERPACSPYETLKEIVAQIVPPRNQAVPNPSALFQPAKENTPQHPFEKKYNP